jgi:hypothetical protein
LGIRTRALPALAVLVAILTPVAFSAPASVAFGYTHLQPDGNRWMPGRGALPVVAPIDIPLAGEPRWVVAAPAAPGAAAAAGSLWIVVLEDGRVQAFRVDEPSPVAVRAESIAPSRLPPGMPPLLKLAAGSAALLMVPGRDASGLTPPAIIGPGRLAYVARGGDLVITGTGRPERLPYRALPDARILVDGTGRLLLLTGATTRYGHGALGDRVEAASITLFDPRRTPRLAVTIALPPPRVVEGIAPLWVDVTGDGRRDIVVTASDNQTGGRIQVFSETGKMIASGPGFTQGSRWRHPIAVAPFGPTGERELAVVRTPHLGGVVEFYRVADGRLTIVAELGGFTSHVLGSRNLDMAAAGDFDGDGHAELLLPDQALTTLGGIRRTDNGAIVAWTVPLGGRLSTNLSAVGVAGGRLAVGAGRQDRVLRIWFP